MTNSIAYASDIRFVFSWQFWVEVESRYRFIGHVVDYTPSKEIDQTMIELRLILLFHDFIRQRDVGCFKCFEKCFLADDSLWHSRGITNAQALKITSMLQLIVIPLSSPWTVNSPGYIRQRNALSFTEFQETIPPLSNY